MRKLLLLVGPPSQFKSLKNIKFCHNFSRDGQILLIMSRGLCRHLALRSSQQRKVGRSVACPHKQQPGGRRVWSDLLRSLLSVSNRRGEKRKRNYEQTASLGPASALGENSKKNGEQSRFPLPRTPLGWLRSPMFFLFDPVFFFLFPPLWSLVQG